MLYPVLLLLCLSYFLAKAIFFYINKLYIRNSLIYEIFDSMPVGIVVSDPKLPDNPIIFCNKTFEEMTGWKRLECVGENCRFMNKGIDTSDLIFSILRQRIDAGESFRGIIQNRRKDGAKFLNELTIFPVYENKVLKHFIGIQNDLTTSVEKYDSVNSRNSEIREQKINI